MSCWVTQDSDSASKEGKGREEKWRKGKGGEGKEMGRGMGKREGRGAVSSQHQWEPGVQ